MKIIEVTDLNRPELAVYAELSERQLATIYEPEEGLFITESPKVIERALDGGYEPVSFLAEKGQLAEAEEILDRMEDVPIYVAPDEILTKLTGYHLTRGLWCTMRRRTLPTIEEVCQGAKRIALMEDEHFEKQGRRIINRCGNIPVYTAPFEVLTGITGFQLTRGMLCAMYRGDLASVEEVCRNARRIAVLENVVNPTNVGALFRCAAALGMDAVILTGGCSDPLYRRASRVSMGTVFQIPWTMLSKKDGVWPEQAMKTLKEMGFKTAAMALREDSVGIDDPQLNSEEKLAIVLGTEGDGLAGDTIADCDYTVMIPMAHGVDSLNAAAGVVSVCKDCASTTGKGGLLAVEIPLTGIDSIHLESYSISRRK